MADLPKSVAELREKIESLTDCTVPMKTGLDALDQLCALAAPEAAKADEVAELRAKLEAIEKDRDSFRAQRDAFRNQVDDARDAAEAAPDESLVDACISLCSQRDRLSEKLEAAEQAVSYEALTCSAALSDLAAARADQRAVAVEELRGVRAWAMDRRSEHAATDWGKGRKDLADKLIGLVEGAIAALTAPAAEPINFPELRKLVAAFSTALLDKLIAAEKKYGHNDAWLAKDWELACRDRLRDHVEKGDPRDVAAYCAFMWHHGWRTAPAAEPEKPPRCGDSVIHSPSGEEWIVAYVEGDYLSPAGYPECLAKLSDCKIDIRCSDAIHRREVAMWRDSSGEGIRRGKVLELYGSVLAEPEKPEPVPEALSLLRVSDLSEDNQRETCENGSFHSYDERRAALLAKHKETK